MIRGHPLSAVASSLVLACLIPVQGGGEPAKKPGQKPEQKKAKGTQEESGTAGLPDLSQDHLRPRGVTGKIEIGITKGLRYLVRTQNRDGSWRNSGGYGSYPVCMSSLAGVALAMSGSTPTRGKYAPQIRRCVDYVLRQSLPNGLITAMNEETQPMYGHGFSTMFLAEVYGMEEDPKRQKKIHRILTRAWKLTARSQSYAGGWLYAPDDAGDEGSVTVTQVQALRACRNAGVAVDPKVIAKAVKYIADSQNPDGGIRYRASGGGSSRPAISAAAVAVLYNAGKYDDGMAEKALQYAKRSLPVSGGGHHYYAHLYLAQALYQKGGKDWDSYYQKMSAWLLRQQRADGSWMGDGVGTTYGTAIALTILQLPYARLPIYQR